MVAPPRNVRGSVRSVRGDSSQLSVSDKLRLSRSLAAALRCAADDWKDWLEEEEDRARWGSANIGLRTGTGFGRSVGRSVFHVGAGAHARRIRIRIL